MSAADEVRSRYAQYLEEIDQVIATAKPGAGLFGIGVAPKNDPCNDRFMSDMQKWFEAFVSSEPSSEDTASVLSYVYEAQESRRQDFVFFTLTAIHGMTIPLISRLMPERADAYETRIPRQQRLPVQQTLLKALYERAGRMPARRGLFGRKR